MKLTLIIALILVTVLLIQSKCSKPDYPENYIENLQSKNDSLIAVAKWRLESSAYWKKRADMERKAKDSLLAMIPALKSQITQAQTEINEAILKDSLNANTEYRKGLAMLYPDYSNPNNNSRISLYETGLGALIFPETKGLRLTVSVQNEALQVSDSIETALRHSLSDALFAVKGWEQVAQNNEDAFTYFKNKYEDTKGFFYHRFSFQIGVYTIYSSDGRIVPGVGLGLGINLWMNE